MRFLIPLILAALALCLTAPSFAETTQEILAANSALVEKASRQTIGPVIEAIARSGEPEAAAVLVAWGDKGLGIRKADRAFFLITVKDGGFELRDLAGAAAGRAAKSDIIELKPNPGVRGMIATALVQFTLSDPDPDKRTAALESIAKDPKGEALAPLRAAIDGETDAGLKAQKQRLERLLTLRFDPDPATPVAAIDSFGSDLGLDLRAALNPLLATTQLAVAGKPDPSTKVARTLRPGRDLPEAEAYEVLVAQGLAPARLTLEAQRAALVANVQGGMVGGVALADLDSQAARDRAYTALEAARTVPQAATDDEAKAALAAHSLLEIYVDTDPAVTAAAKAALACISTKVGAMQTADLALDALSLASI